MILHSNIGIISRIGWDYYSSKASRKRKRKGPEKESGVGQEWWQCQNLSWQKWVAKSLSNLENSEVLKIFALITLIQIPPWLPLASPYTNEGLGFISLCTLFFSWNCVEMKGIKGIRSHLWVRNDQQKYELWIRANEKRHKFLLPPSPAHSLPASNSFPAIVKGFEPLSFVLQLSSRLTML